MPPAGRAVRPRTFTGRLLLANAVAVTGILLVLGVVAYRLLERSFVSQLTDSLATDARVVQAALPEAAAALQLEVARLGAAVDARITVIGTDGVVLADSDHDPGTMDNHLQRPEVQQARSGQVGSSTRTSATLGIEFRYVALPPSNGRIVRVALPLTDVRARLSTVRAVMAAGFGLATLAVLAVLLVIARATSRPLGRMAAAVERVSAGTGGEAPNGAVPEDGPDELVVLARTINRMRTDISSRISVMERERQTREAILSSLDEGVTLVEADGSVRYQNDVARRLVGSVSSVRDLDPPALRDLMGRALEEGTPRAVEATIGEGRTVQAAAVAVAGQGQILLVLRDVTEAREVDAVRRDFVANASHELKTPVASIRALAETIAMSAFDDPDVVARFAGQLEREAVRLSRVVSDLLDLSRLEGRPGEMGPVRLDVLVAQEAERFRRRAEDARLSLSIEAGAPLRVRGSARDLALLVRNLVENAIHYTRPGGRIGVTLLSRDHRAVIRVRDTGRGIPKKDQSRIFERFYRVDRARSRETGGTGLGLSIVRHIAENHGGSVTVESTLGEGSTFTVTLPVENSAAGILPSQ